MACALKHIPPHCPLPSPNGSLSAFPALPQNRSFPVGGSNPSLPGKFCSVSFGFFPSASSCVFARFSFRFPSFFHTTCAKVRIFRWFFLSLLSHPPPHTPYATIPRTTLITRFSARLGFIAAQGLWCRLGKQQKVCESFRSRSKEAGKVGKGMEECVCNSISSPGKRRLSVVLGCRRSECGPRS